MPKQQTQSHVMTSSDAQRLKQLLERTDAGKRDQDYIEHLEEELEAADVVSPESISADVVTINSQFCIQDVDTGDEMVYTLVMPRDAEIEKGRVSIMAPLGTAIFGQKVGDIAEFKVPAGLRRVKITQILYQPEAAGDYQL
jgi:regulator of nucleoside diphosphate kinase